MDFIVNSITLSFLQWFLISLGALLLGLFLGWWLWYKYRSLSAQLEREKNEEHKKYNDLRQEYDALKYKSEELEKTNGKLKTSLNRCEADKAVLQHKLDKAIAEGPPPVKGTGDVNLSGGAKEGQPIARGISSAGLKPPKSVKIDDLKIVEGVGPKIETLMKDAGIKTWKDLSVADPEKIKKILANAGSRYRLADPTTWPKQAQMASEGKWEELKMYQDALKGGRELK